MAIKMSANKVRELELKWLLGLLKANYDQGLSVAAVVHIYGWTSSKARARLNQLVKRTEAYVEPDQDDGTKNRYFYRDDELAGGDSVDEELIMAPNDPWNPEDAMNQIVALEMVLDQRGIKTGAKTNLEVPYAVYTAIRDEFKRLDELVANMNDNINALRADLRYYQPDHDEWDDLDDDDQVEER